MPRSRVLQTKTVVTDTTGWRPSPLLPPWLYEGFLLSIIYYEIIYY